MVVDELEIDRVKDTTNRQELGSNEVFLERLAQVRSKVPARLLRRMNRITPARFQRRVQVNGGGWYVCR